MVCFRYINVNTLHNGGDDDDNNNNNNNNIMSVGFICGILCHAKLLGLTIVVC